MARAPEPLVPVSTGGRVPSKAELYLHNAELTSRNAHLHKTLTQARHTAGDLQNVLFSLNLATVFLDTGLNIRFFTPATRLLFNISPDDVGRPLAGVISKVEDAGLVIDARDVLAGHTLQEREIRSEDGAWYVRRILPYRTAYGGFGMSDGTIQGVVITFGDITGQRKISIDLQIATREAQLANAGKSRFLAAASHDLRQPLQSLSLLQGLLAKVVQGDTAKALVDRLDDVLGAISGMLSALLDVNQIESGTVHVERVSFPVNDLLHGLRSEFSYLAQAQRLELHIVPCRLIINSDPRLLEQMVRNLVANALKYTPAGRVLIGCRRRGALLSLEVWDSGIGIAASELRTIFDEFHQVDNAVHDPSRVIGLGLSIVQRLSHLLGHPVRVRSWPGKGSVFSINIDLSGGPRDPVEPLRAPPCEKGIPLRPLRHNSSGRRRFRCPRPSAAHAGGRGPRHLHCK